MIKFLINFASFVLCVGILAFSGYKTYADNRIEEMVNDFQTVMDSDFTIPGAPDNNDGEVSTPDDGKDPDDDGITVPDDDNNDSSVGGDGTGNGDNDSGSSSNSTLSSQDAKDAFGSFYDNSDPTFNDMNKELFTSMLSSLLGKVGGDSDSGSDVTPDDGDFNDSFNGDFGTSFNPDEFEPEDDPEADHESELEDFVVGIAGTYYENLQLGIQEHQQANNSGTEEEQQAAREEFIERESEAFAGVVNVLTNPEEKTDEELVQSVDAVLNSSVCLNTVTQSIENDEKLSDSVQESTQGMSESSKEEIKGKIEAALEANPENEEQYNYLADLFGITLGNASAN